jgi:hypothetical protein
MVWTLAILIIFIKISGDLESYSGFTDNACNHRIFCLTGTWLNDTIFSHNHFSTSYSVFHVDRDCLNSHTTRGGGVLFALSNLWEGVMRRHDLEATKECVRIEIPVSDNFSLLIGNRYFPPDCNVTIIAVQILVWNVNAHQYRAFMLGDFNVNNRDTSQFLLLQ